MSDKPSLNCDSSLWGFRMPFSASDPRFQDLLRRMNFPP